MEPPTTVENRVAVGCSKERTEVGGDAFVSVTLEVLTTP